MSLESPFSFHCMICYEEFHAEARWPVVLPCGHTYVCCVCAERLDKCMECRTLLYKYAPPVEQPPTWNRSNPRGVAQAPPPRRKLRLPLPKNVVLLSLMEATELVSRDVHQKFSQSPETKQRKKTIAENDKKKLDKKEHDDENDPDQAKPPSPLMDEPEDDDSSSSSEEEDEEEKIKTGTMLAVGTAGTYAVANRQGLDILPTRPSSRDNIHRTTPDYGDIDNVVRVHSTSLAKSSSAEEKNNANEQPLMSRGKLDFGDRVQVVSIDGKWAQLARGYGYVLAERNTLVKGMLVFCLVCVPPLDTYHSPTSPSTIVGNSVDRACKIEAFLRSLAIRRKELRVEQSKVDNNFIRLMNQLQDSLENDEDLTVICGRTLADASKAEAATPAPLVEVTQDANVHNAQDGPQKPPRLNTLQEEDQANASQPSSPFICFTNPMFSCDGDEAEEESDTSGILPSFSSHSLLATEREPSQYQLSAGARAWRERNLGDERVNFRTGMSGHMGLVSSNSHSHSYLESQSYKMGKMSSHRGVSSLSASPFSFLGSLFSSPSQDERDLMRIHRADSV